MGDAAAKQMFQAVESLAGRWPELSAALDGVLEEMRRQPKTVAEKRALDQRLIEIGKAFIGVRDAFLGLREISQVASAEQRDTLVMNESLRTRITELEAEIKAWQREYEPDTDPDRPAFFSNIRQALRAFHTPHPPNRGTSR